MPASATSKWGQNREEPAALLRVRTGPECPEGDRRELLWVTNLNCGTAREREKINRPEHPAGPFTEQRKNWAIPEKSQPEADRPSPRRRQEAAGRGKGPTRPQRRHPHQTANRLPVSNQRPPEILDGWHLPGGSRLETSSPEQTQGTPDWCARKLRLGPRRGEGARHPGRERPASSWRPELLGGEGTKRRPNRVRVFVENPNTGTTRHAGPAPWRAAWSLSSVDGESTRRERGQTVWSEHCRSSPHRPVTFVCSAPPSPQHDWTREPEQETTSARLCQGGN